MVRLNADLIKENQSALTKVFKMNIRGLSAPLDEQAWRAKLGDLSIGTINLCVPAESVAKM